MGVPLNSTRFALARGGTYLRAAMLVPSDFSDRSARVEVVETAEPGQALRLCTHRNAARVASLINLHVRFEHMRWHVVKL